MPRRKNYEIRVTIRTKDGKTYLRFRDPLTGSEQIRLATKKTASEIQREAGAWQNELKENAGRKALEDLKAKRAAEIVNSSWKVFRDQFSSSHLLSLAANSDKAFTAALNLFEQLTPRFPDNLKEITANHISEFAAAYRSTGVSETTIASRLSHIRAAMQWAMSTGKMIDSLPEFPRVKRAKKGQRVRPSRGRAISDEEFKKILDVIGDVVSAEHGGIAIPLWKAFLEGLWWSGLRLSEALSLSWDNRADGVMWIEMARFSHPMLIIPAAAEKGVKDRVYPVAPEFAAILKAMYKKNINGLVFPLTIRKTRQNADRSQIGLETASAMIRKICEKAGVFTHFRGQGKDRQEQSAGAQDFRRAFGDRWARRVKSPQVLQKMMRHENIETTMQYYVNLEAESLAADIYAAFDSESHSPDCSPDTSKPKQTKV